MLDAKLVSESVSDSFQGYWLNYPLTQLSYAIYSAQECSVLFNLG